MVKRTLSGLALTLVALTLAGCASSSVGTNNAPGPEDITPIQNVPVASSNLPVLGAPSSRQDPDTLVIDDGVGRSSDPMVSSQAPAQGRIITPPQTASNEGSFVTLGAPGTNPGQPGRDLTGGLTVEKLLGGWTVVSGQQQCRLNLTYTAKTGTSRYRASTPGCTIAGLSVVASWQLVGTQVQLFDENNDIIASLILSGNRFIGTLAGGQGISMVG